MQVFPARVFLLKSVLLLSCPLNLVLAEDNAGAAIEHNLIQCGFEKYARVSSKYEDFR